MATSHASATETSQLDALEEGSAFAELAGWSAVSVEGADARGWLHDLVTADVEGLEPGRARRSLVLTPTGRIRADLHVVAERPGFVLLQAPDQPEAVDEILGPYVLSSDVRIADRSRELALFVVLGDLPPGETESRVSSPSVLGPGVNLLVEAGASDGLRGRLRASGKVESSLETLERWRILRGAVRMGADLGPDSLPAEAGLEDAIDFTKGCFLGQESVAKVRNLGHPPRILLPVGSDARLAKGDPVFAGGSRVGEITSAAEVRGETLGIARVRWDAGQGRSLGTPSGPLRVRQLR